MKKNLLLFFLIPLFSGVLKAQSRATTVNEYNYLVSGNYSFSLPGYRLIRSNVDVKMDFSDGNREAIVWEFYRPDASSPCALMLEYHNLLGTHYLCVPDINSQIQLWQAYHAKLREINENAGMNGLELIAYTMSVYAAGH